MIKVVIDLALLTIIIVYVIDLSGFIDTFKGAVSKIITKGKISKTDFRLKPFDCSLCTTLWSGLIYLAIVEQFNLIGIALVVGFSLIGTNFIRSFIDLIMDVWNKIISLLYKYLKL